MLADAIDKTQTACFELGIQILLTLFVFFRTQLLAEWVPCRDEGGAVGVSFGHQAQEFGAGLADSHFEGRVSVDEVFRLFVGLDEFGGNVVMHNNNFTQLDFISARTKEALAKGKADSVKLGRPPRPPKNLRLDQLADKIDERSIAKLLDVSQNMLYVWLIVRRPVTLE